MRVLRGRRVFPTVAADGTPTGVSGNGSTLVLADPAYPRRVSHLTVLSSHDLRRAGAITLRGDFTLDAISPKGDRIYLIQTLGPTHYAVRAYDVAQRRLLPKPIVDPAEADEPMNGLPFARVMSPDDRWAYTLYVRPEGEPFVHALDTQDGRAKCVDLDGVGQVDELTLGPGGDLRVQSGARTIRVVDRRTFAVRRPQFAAPAARAPADEGGSGWLAPVAGAALLALLAVAAVRAGGRRLAH
jgi:hypothetical protein